MAQDQVKSGEIDFSSENIFDDFAGSEDIKDDVQRFEEKQAKDLYFYLKKFNSVFFIINILTFVGIVLSVAYIYIQNGQVKKPYSMLAPICSVFLWEVNINSTSCYGVTGVLLEYTDKLKLETENQARKVLPILGEAYSIENFNLSKKVRFLLDKSTSRVKPLEILAAFDALKQSFAPLDKVEITCYDIIINRGDIMEVTCDAFSSHWDSKIVNLDNGNIGFVDGGGTSISRASSFIYFLDNYGDSPFKVIEKPEKLSSKAVQGWGPYTQVTTFQLQLQYIKNEDLSF